MELFTKGHGIQTRWASFENPSAAASAGGTVNKGRKGFAFDRIPAGESRTLLDVKGSGRVCRIWCTIQDRSPQMLRGLRLDIWWDDAALPAVSVPFGDFFGIGLGQTSAFESVFFCSPEARSFNCTIPMPFRSAARIVLTNESGKDLSHLFYDVDILLNEKHADDVLYFHACWRRENLNRLGEDFTLLPKVPGEGRFLGANIGVKVNQTYEETWWGEGEIKMWMGAEELPTLCGTGAEDYPGSAWGFNGYARLALGCPICDHKLGLFGFYRYHVADPVFFYDGLRVAMQTIGGGPHDKVLAMKDRGVPLIPVSIDTPSMKPLVRLMDLPQPVDYAAQPAGWMNFLRQDDWSSCCYLYLARPDGVVGPLLPAAERMADLITLGDTSKRMDG